MCVAEQTMLTYARKLQFSNIHDLAASGQCTAL